MLTTAALVEYVFKSIFRHVADFSSVVETDRTFSPFWLLMKDKTKQVESLKRSADGRNHVSLKKIRRRKIKEN